MALRLSVIHVGEGEQNCTIYNLSGWVGPVAGWDVFGKYRPPGIRFSIQLLSETFLILRRIH
jgi:hypothetical protein